MSRQPPFDSLRLRRLTYVSWLAIVIQPPLLQITGGAEMAILIPPWFVIAVHAAYYFAVLRTGFGFSASTLAMLAVSFEALAGAASYCAGWEAGLTLFLCLSLFVPQTLIAALSAGRMLKWGRLQTGLFFVFLLAFPPLIFVQLYLWAPALMTGEYALAIAGLLVLLAVKIVRIVVSRLVHKRARALLALQQRATPC